MEFCKRYIFLILAFAGHISQSMEQTYEDVLDLYNDKMSSDKYNIDIRPVKDQSRVLYVGVSFELLAIIDLDEVSQSFNCNGFVTFYWIDELLSWNHTSYGGHTTIHPQAKNIWRPKIIFANTLEDRDIFGEDDAPLTVYSNGTVLWFPGSTFPSACALNMTKYPFDEQICTIQFLSMGFTLREVQFLPVTDIVGLNFYIKNGEWQLTSTQIISVNVSDDFAVSLSGILIIFNLRRNPVGILINLILPIVFISFLNLWVFVIPVESGEKISYGTTVLMALSVFMTNMSALLPVSSDQLPLLVLYIFILLIISLLTVVTSIIIVFLHHKEEQQDNHLRAKTKLNSIFHKVTLVNRAVSAIDNGKNSKALIKFNLYQQYPKILTNLHPLPMTIRRHTVKYTLSLTDTK